MEATIEATGTRQLMLLESGPCPAPGVSAPAQALAPAGDTDIYSERPRPFPTILGRDFEIRMEREAGLVSSPYAVTIHGDGRVIFDLDPGFSGRTPRTATPLVERRISKAAVDALVTRFRRARFFAAKDRY